MKLVYKLISQLRFVGPAICFVVVHAAFAQTGDFNQDGIYDCFDIDALNTEISAGTDNLAFDLDGDGMVNQVDQFEWFEEAGAVNLPSGNSYLPADGNLDGSVDVSDFNLWNDEKFTNNPAYCSGDYNADGDVDVSDFMIWNNNVFLSSDSASGRRPSPGAIDGKVTFAYDPESGLLTMDTGDIGVNCFAFNGPNPLDTMDLGSGFVDDNGSLWQFSEYESHLKWLSNESTDASGVFELAVLETGLTADDFGEIGFMNQALEMGTTTIQIVQQPSVVPEPSGFMLMVISAAAMLLSRRCR